MTPVILTPTKLSELPPAADGLEQVAAWLGTGDAASLQQTFPQIYDPLGRGRRFAIHDGTGELVSHAATIDVELHDRTRALLIGSVVTAPVHRRRGFASQIVSELVSHATRDGFDSVLLWSNLEEFYARLGFEPAGSQFAVPCTGQAAKLPAGATIRDAVAGDLPGILRLHERKPMRVRRTLADLAVLMSARPMKTVVLEHKEKVRAYACYDKGADLTGWWHEFGGEDELVTALVETAMDRISMPTALALIPPYRARLRRHFDAPAVPRPTALRHAITASGNGDFFVDGLDSV